MRLATPIVYSRQAGAANRYGGEKGTELDQGRPTGGQGHQIRHTKADSMKAASEMAGREAGSWPSTGASSFGGNDPHHHHPKQTVGQA